AVATVEPAVQVQIPIVFRLFLFAEGPPAHDPRNPPPPGSRCLPFPGRTAESCRRAGPLPGPGRQGGRGVPGGPAGWIQGGSSPQVCPADGLVFPQGRGG